MSLSHHTTTQPNVQFYTKVIRLQNAFLLPVTMECWCQCARRRWTPSWFSWAGAMAYEAPPLPNTVRCRVCLQRMSPKAWKEAWKNNVSVSVNTLYMCIFSQESELLTSGAVQGWRETHVALSEEWWSLHRSCHHLKERRIKFDIPIYHTCNIPQDP